MLHNGHLASLQQEINTKIVEKLRKTRSELAESRDMVAYRTCGTGLSVNF